MKYSIGNVIQTKIFKNPDNENYDVEDDTQQLAGQHHPPQQVPQVPQRGEATSVHRSFHSENHHMLICPAVIIEDIRYTSRRRHYPS